MSDFYNNPIIRVARKRHRCIYCAEVIEKGDKYIYQSGNYDGHFYANHFHPECFEDAFDEYDDEFTPYSNERPRKEILF